MAEHAAEHHHPSYLGHHFDTLEQQHDANVVGMWTFLITEIMLFGGLFVAYTVFRVLYPQAWAEGSHHLNIFIGTTNTAVLILSSFTVVLAVHAVQTNQPRRATVFMIATIILGLVFLGFKGVEYYEHWVHHQIPGALFQYEGSNPELASRVHLFTFMYFMMTGTHALHMIIGISVVAYITVRIWRGKYHSRYFTPVELTGLYWHLIDIIWVFLFPLLYLIGRT
jgi:cytochrome c oxidase subunit III